LAGNVDLSTQTLLKSSQTKKVAVKGQVLTGSVVEYRGRSTIAGVASASKVTLYYWFERVALPPEVVPSEPSNILSLL